MMKSGKLGTCFRSVFTYLEIDEKSSESIQYTGELIPGRNLYKKVYFSWKCRTVMRLVLVGIKFTT